MCQNARLRSSNHHALGVQVAHKNLGWDLGSNYQWAYLFNSGDIRTHAPCAVDYKSQIQLMQWSIRVIRAGWVGWRGWTPRAVTRVTRPASPTPCTIYITITIRPGSAVAGFIALRVWILVRVSGSPIGAHYNPYLSKIITVYSTQ